MLTVQSAADAPPQPKKSKLSKLGLFLAFLIVIGAFAFAVWHFGSPQSHQVSTHQLYATFDASAPHKKILEGIGKTKVSLLVGKKEDGLFNFVQHYANSLTSKGRTVYVQQYSSSNPQIFQIAKDINTQVLSTLGQLKNDSDWIVLSENGEKIPDQVIIEIQTNYPSSKILIATTTKEQKFKGAKSFSYPRLDDKLVGKSIAKAFGVKTNIADILADYYKTHQALFEGLNQQKFDAKEYLGEDYATFEGLSKEGLKVLADLCKSGQLKSKKKQTETPGLAQYGVIFARNTPLWQDERSILNYELYSGVNCKNVVATEEDIRTYQQFKQKEEEARKAKEEQERRKEEERKAKEQQAKRKQQQLKAAQQKKKEEAQKKKEEAKKKKEEPKPQPETKKNQKDTSAKAPTEAKKASKAKATPKAK